VGTTFTRQGAKEQADATAEAAARLQEDLTGLTGHGYTVGKPSYYDNGKDRCETYEDGWENCMILIPVETPYGTQFTVRVDTSDMWKNETLQSLTFQ
jgi:hypothetical protein